MTTANSASSRHSVDAIVVGAGHAGLAISKCLTERSIDHVILERGEVANSWRKERWDSLTLLTPNWQCSLPDYKYEGSDPDGYMTMPELIEFIDQYARVISAPVRTNTNVTSVRFESNRYRVATDKGAWTSKSVVLASGGCNLPVVPRIDKDLPDTVRS
ncbi:MAG: NAD(P)-binding domain-containing protein, partial [Gammaproteobacteria bacterium]|nr:NAD(P)-binding domain-containing protein [Gammaproteobacteria bacterium]